MRDTYLRMWRSRGGGFYGLGYVVAFIVLEIHATISSWASASDNIAGLVVEEVLQFVFRFAAQSMLNGFLALGWPIFVVDKSGGAGLVLVAVAWWLFDRYARPWIAQRLPEPSSPDGELHAAAAADDAAAKGAGRGGPPQSSSADRNAANSAAQDDDTTRIRTPNEPDGHR